MDDDYNDYAGFAADDSGDSLAYTYSLPTFTVAEDRVTDDTGDDSSWWTDAPTDDPFAAETDGWDFSDVFDSIGDFFSSTLGKVFSGGGSPQSGAQAGRPSASGGSGSSGSRNQTTNTTNVSNVTNQNVLAFAVGAVAVLAVVYLLRRQAAPAA